MAEHGAGRRNRSAYDRDRIMPRMPTAARDFVPLNRERQRLPVLDSSDYYAAMLETSLAEMQRLDAVTHKVCDTCEQSKPVEDYKRDMRDSRRRVDTCRACEADLAEELKRRMNPGAAERLPPTRKRCATCRRALPLSQFPHRAAADGSTYPRNKCRKCETEYIKAWKRRKREGGQ